MTSHGRTPVIGIFNRKAGFRVASGGYAADGASKNRDSRKEGYGTGAFGILRGFGAAGPVAVSVQKCLHCRAASGNIRRVMISLFGSENDCS